VIGSFRYGSGAPSRSEMFKNFLESFPADIQKSLLFELCEYSPSMKTPPLPKKCDASRLSSEALLSLPPLEQTCNKLTRAM
jgi:hypothetical protein